MSSFKKRTDFFLTSKWVLLFVFVVSMGMLIGFAMARDMFGIVLFTLIGFLTSFFSKNMIVILLISIGLTGVIAGMYPVEMRRIEGFGEDESFGHIEGFEEGMDPDQDKEEEEDTKKPEKGTEKDSEKKKPEKGTEKDSEKKKPEKGTEKDSEKKKPEKKPETKKPEKSTEKSKEKPDGLGLSEIQKMLGDSEKFSSSSFEMPKFDFPTKDEFIESFEDKLLNIYEGTMNKLVEKSKKDETSSE
jgi:hypothetical protein